MLHEQIYFDPNPFANGIMGSFALCKSLLLKSGSCRADKELVSLLEGFDGLKSEDEKVKWAASALQLKDTPDPSR